MDFKRYSGLFISLISAGLLTMSCGGKDSSTGSDHPVLEIQPQAEVCGASHVAWGYEGAIGPDHWAELSPEYAVAASGREQSPINIVTADAVKGDLPPINYNYDDANVYFFNNGHTVQANIEDGSNYITIGSERYDLAQFHFHTVSENSVNGEYAPVEMHLVHRSASGELAVVGVFFNEGEENETLGELWKKLPAEKMSGYSSAEEIEVDELIPENRSCYRFNGSLTTPPCTEGVKWTVMANSLEMSSRQICDFVNLFSGAHFPEGNRRPVQPLYERVVVLDECDHDDDDCE